ncbi:putative F-box protein At3g52320 [Chenopodium quinoa]|uniref:putative F-box protein At3g52320 n=1 Tax=Chenopodium quinoa TaxID=63459 RepID=UPI000B7991A7|nr:putative F-box protein At3g52320 [Chenopodium quinoa]
MSTIEKTLPKHLILQEILPRLPVKSLIRFKSVSKSWLSTIISPKFTKTHLKISSFRPHFLVHATLHRASDDEIYLLQYDHMNCNVRNFIELEFANGYDLPIEVNYIVGSCNGLVCLLGNEHRSREVFYVCNPATRRLRKIKKPGGVGRADRSGCVFCYESSTDDYIIFGAFSSRHDDFVHFYVFSLSAGNWRRREQ